MATFRIALGPWAKELKDSCVDIENAFESLKQAVSKFNDNSPALKMQICINIRRIDWPENSCRSETMGYIGWDPIEGRNIEK